MVYGNTKSIRGIILRGTSLLCQIMLMSIWFLTIYCKNMGLICWPATARTFSYNWCRTPVKHGPTFSKIPTPLQSEAYSLENHTKYTGLNSSTRK
jgi:hypothetical protein